MTEIITRFFEYISQFIGAPSAAIIVSFLPFAEARLSIPLSLSYGLTPTQSFLTAYLGSSLPAFVTLPLLKLLFTRGSKAIKAKMTELYGAKFEKYKKVSKKKKAKEKKQATEFDPNSAKSLICLGGFVALPLPMTGVWSGTVIAALAGGKSIRAAAAIAAGNLIACVIILTVSLLFAPYVNIIVTVLTSLALVAAVAALIKAIIKNRH